MKKLLFALSFCISVISFAQVGVGTAAPDASAQLDVVATDKGILIPRLNIVDLNTAAPVAAADIDVSLLAYNTNATSGKGYYYWDGTKWARISGIATGNGAPTTTNPANPVAGDIYVDESTGDIYIHDGNTWVVNESDETLTKISQNATAGTITYTDEEGNNTVLDLKALIAANETTSTLVDNGDGTYTYKDEDGKETTIDTNADTGYVDDGTIDIDGDGTPDNDVTIQDALEAIAANAEKVSPLKDNGNGTYTYTDEEGTKTTFDVNNPKIKDNGDGTYTVTNADGTTSTIDTNADTGYVDDGTIDIDGDGTPDNNVTIQDALEAIVDTVDATDDEWINDNANTRVDLAKLSDGTTDRPANRRVAVTDEGHLLVGTDVDNTDNNGSRLIQANNGDLAYFTDEAHSGSYGIVGYKSRGTSKDAPVVVQAGDNISNHYGLAYNGAGYDLSGMVGTEVDASWNGTQSKVPGAFHIRLRDNTSPSLKHRFYIMANGNTGIDTTTPTHKLDVNGMVRVRDLTGTDAATDVVVTADATTGELRDGGTVASIIAAATPTGQDVTSTNGTITGTAAGAALVAMDLEVDESKLEDIPATAITGGTDGQVLTTDANGDVVWTDASGNTSAVTQTVTTGNKLATHDDGNGTTVDILETVTTVTKNADNTHTYKSEDGTETIIADHDWHEFILGDYAAGATTNQASAITKNIYTKGTIVTGNNHEKVDATNSIIGGIMHSVSGANNIVTGYNNKNITGKFNAILGRDHDEVSTDYNLISGMKNTKVSGVGNSISGQNHSVISGHHNNISGATNSNITGNYNIIAGNNNTNITSHNNFVIGNLIDGISGENNMIFGYQVKNVSGAGNFVGGSGHDGVPGNYNAILGKAHTVTGNLSTVVGNENTSAADYSFVMGMRNSVALGADNSSVISGTGITATAANTAYGANAEFTGKVTANDFLASGTNTPYADYVFEDYVDGKSTLNSNYKFKSLSEVEAFIKANKHLPGVTGINDLEKDKDGNYLVNMNKLANQSLEKIEELFLHTIEQQKTIETLEDENVALKARLAKIEAKLGL